MQPAQPCVSHVAYAPLACAAGHGGGSLPFPSQGPVFLSRACFSLFPQEPVASLHFSSFFEEPMVSLAELVGTRVEGAEG